MSRDYSQLIIGCEQVLPVGELEKKCALDRPLRIKAGFDPTAADLHLGHAVLFKKLADFQSQGHEVIVIIGDYTAKIGDPSGRNTTRPPLTDEAIKSHAKTYEDQLYTWLDPQQTQVVYNSSWYDSFDLTQMIQLAGKVTVAQLMERDDFAKRYKDNQPIGMHELLYPILQGYDSVMVKADVELGGTDQTFNLMMGRELQRLYKQAPQVVCTLPLLEGTDGVKKMSKSYDNYIAVKDKHQTMYGKLMSIPDAVLWRYFMLLTDESAEAIEERKQAVLGGDNPMSHKHDMAVAIVSKYHDELKATESKEGFIAQFSEKKVPTDMPGVTLLDAQRSQPLSVLLREWGLCQSSSEAIRLIKQGAVKLNGERIHSGEIAWLSGENILQVGKRRWLKVQAK